MPETLTLMRLRIAGQLAETLCSTNPCESMIEIVRHTQRKVKRWRDGDMRRRCTAAGMLVAEQQFRTIIGDRDLATLVVAIERHALLAPLPDPGRLEVSEPVTVCAVKPPDRHSGAPYRTERRAACVTAVVSRDQGWLGSAERRRRQGARVSPGRLNVPHAGETMPRYVVLVDWTEHGARNFKDSVNRHEASKSQLEAIGVRFADIYWTLGNHDSRDRRCTRR